MILLIEGVAGTGKSRLARAFSEALAVPVAQFVVPPAEAAPYFEAALDVLFSCARHFILVRSHLSNIVDAEAGLGRPLESRAYAAIEERLRQADCWLFLLVEAPGVLAERQGVRAPLTREEIGGQQNRFVTLFERSALAPKAMYRCAQFLEGNRKTAQFEQIVAQLQEALGDRR